MKELAQFIKILGDANRLEIIHALADNACSVSEIIKATSMSQTLVSFHLRAMRKQHIVTTRRDGPFIYYRLQSPELYGLIADLARIAGVENKITRACHSLVGIGRDKKVGLLFGK